MHVHITDTQIVSETEGTLWSIAQASINMLVVLKNCGTNTINYRFQEHNGSTWVDMDESGTDFYNTLTSTEVKTMKVTSANAQVRLVGNASGGSQLDFGVTREVTRTSGGNITLLAT